MRSLFIILFSFFCLLGCSQPPGYVPQKGYPYLVKDAKGKIIGADIAGVFSALAADTTSESLVQPPDTAQSFTVNVGGTDEPFTSLTTEIRSAWTFEESSGDAVDSLGIADLPLFGSGITQGSSGIINNGYAFTGSGHLGDIDTYYEMTGSFTLEIWVESSFGGQYQGLMTNYGSGNRGFDLLQNNGGAGTAGAIFSIRGEWGTVGCYGSIPINDGVLHHIVGQYNVDDDTLKLWVDGVLDDKEYSVNGPVYGAVGRFQIAARGGGWQFDGTLDEPKIWNRELTQAEIISQYAAGAPGAGQQYPFPGEGSGGDSLTQTITGIDTRTDTFMVNWAYDADGYPTTRTSDNPLFAFNIDNLAEYSDTTFAWPYLKDTIIKLAFWSGLRETDTWVEVPNYDTCLVDSSAITPPDQDLPGWNIIFEQDFDHHTGLPKEYTNALWLADDWNAKGDWRGSDNQWPEEWIGVNRDSIVVDPWGGTGSNALQFSFCGCELGNPPYPCTGSHRCGDAWQTDLVGYHTETYVSYNILLKAGWDWSNGGKIGVAQSGGVAFPHGDNDSPNENEGFTNEIMWFYQTDGLMWYIYMQDRTTQFGSVFLWDDFQPSGYGVPYNATGGVTLGTDTWYNITTRTVLNTFTGSTANSDGILEAFVNGALIERRSGLKLLPYSNKDYGLDFIFLAMFFGGGLPGAVQDDRALFDDIVVFTIDESVEGVPRGNEPSDPGRVISLPPGVWPKEVE